MASNSFFMEKARQYCAYQERSIFDVNKKLSGWNIDEATKLNIILNLKKENFINEERFATAFAIGKLRNNKWGRNKISYALFQKQLPELTVQIALNAIDEDEYIATLKQVISSKKINEDNDFVRKNKLVMYAKQKGFQPELAWKVVNNEL